MVQYGIIRRVGTDAWVFTRPNASEIPDQDLVHLLNRLAGLGWTVVAAGDFMGTGGDELILEMSLG